MYVSYDRAKKKNWQFLVLTWLSFAGMVKIARGHDRGYARMLAWSLYNRLAMDIRMYVCNTFTPQIKVSNCGSYIADVPQLAVLAAYITDVPHLWLAKIFTSFQQEFTVSNSGM